MNAVGVVISIKLAATFRGRRPAMSGIAVLRRHRKTPQPALRAQAAHVRGTVVYPWVPAGINHLSFRRLIVMS